MIQVTAGISKMQEWHKIHRLPNEQPNNPSYIEIDSEKNLAEHPVYILIDLEKNLDKYAGDYSWNFQNAGMADRKIHLGEWWSK